MTINLNKPERELLAKLLTVERGEASTEIHHAMVGQLLNRLGAATHRSGESPERVVPAGGRATALRVAGHGDGRRKVDPRRVPEEIFPR